jgi:hypothetical protein
MFLSFIPCVILWFSKLQSKNVIMLIVVITKSGWYN